MEIVCPTCNMVYNIPSHKIPKGRKVSTKCKKCDGKIVVEARIDKVKPATPKTKTLDRESAKSDVKEVETSHMHQMTDKQSKRSIVSEATPELRKMNVLLLLLLVFITFGIYIPVWFLRRRKAINGLQARKELGKASFIVLLIIFSVSLLITFSFGFVEANYGADSLLMLEMSDSFLRLIAWIIILVQSYTIRAIFDVHFNQHQQRGISFSSAIAPANVP